VEEYDLFQQLSPKMQT
jgi:hypothetical protein